MDLFLIFLRFCSQLFQLFPPPPSFFCIQSACRLLYNSVSVATTVAVLPVIKGTTSLFRCFVCISSADCL